MIEALIAGFSPWNGLRDGPLVDREGRSTRAGVHVVGDLTDAPILKAAIVQGDAAARAIDAALGQSRSADVLDVVIVGGGPAGIAAALALQELGRTYVIVERDAVFHTIDAFPAGKIMYAEPRDIAIPAGLAFDDARKEDLVADWRDRVHRAGVNVHTGQEVTAIDGTDGAFTIHGRGVDGAITYRARKVIVAIGRRGTPRKLDAPGADLAKVRSILDDPQAWRGRRALVVGGGDSAVEAAVALHDAGAITAIVHRKPTFDRLRKRNRARLDAARSTGLRVIFGTVDSVADDHVVISANGAVEAVPNDVVFALLGTELPVGFLGRLGIALRSDRAAELRRIPGLLAFAAFVWCFYVVKQDRGLFPFVGPLAGVPALLRVPVPWFPTADGSLRVLDAGFFGTLAYSLAILGFGLAAMRRHPTAAQRRRYVSLIGFQWVFLFGIPEVIAPILTTNAGKFYSLSVPWPLSIWSLAHEPAAWGWLLAGALVAFVGIPVYVWRYNLSFCSYLCGCGGLAETFGDLWRWRAPRGPLAKRAEGAGVVILALAVPVTLLVLNDLWGFVGFHTWLDQDVAISATATVTGAAPEQVGSMRIASATIAGPFVDLTVEKYEADRAWHPNGWIREIHAGDAIVYPDKVGEGHYTVVVPPGATDLHVLATGSSLSRVTEFAKSWYALMVDFGLAAFVGVAAYPFLGNRVWCRFFCPLRAWMELLAKRFGRQAIVASDTCVSCGQCTRDCQMGINVQSFAEHEKVLDNTNSACIQCGVCVETCPMGTLSLVDKATSGA